METTILDQHEIYYPDLAKQIQELKLYYQERSAIISLLQQSLDCGFSSDNR